MPRRNPRTSITRPSVFLPSPWLEPKEPHHGKNETYILSLDVARQRLSGLKGIIPAADLGPNLTATIYEAKIDSVSEHMDRYNQRLAEVDQEQNELQKEEAELSDLNRRILAAGEARYGPDSSEYEMLGGKRKSEHKKRARKGFETLQRSALRTHQQHNEQRLAGQLVSMPRFSALQLAAY